ncbi:ATP-binding cassette domain-containing protein [Paenibacillus pinihumi]|uniref:ATP-binding cassette domain-containing protein n=1 Tax=Paenibacillus pinihumi TaxID=669462 RepID=UPI0004104A4B|nr:ABC transporter ATP-binding protein [Paenibacillus pinihumi]
MRSEDALQLRNVSKTMRGKELINNISLAVRPGEIYGLLGPEGAGKTTMVRMITGLASITSGDVLIGGHSVITDRSKALSGLGVVLGGDGFYPFMSGIQAMKQYGRMTGAGCGERIHELLSLFGLEAVMHRKISSYTAEQRRRLAIAQALLHRPSVLIIDDPLLGLKGESAEIIYHEICSLSRREQLAVVLTGGLDSGLDQRCDRSGFIAGGCIAAEQPAARRASGRQKVVTSFEVSDPAKAASLLYHSGFISLDHSVVTIEADKEQLPELMSTLTRHQVGILQIRQEAGALEEIYGHLNEGVHG